MQKHNVVIPKGDGGADVYPMKQWLRDNPGHLPTGVDTFSTTSHQLRSLLRKQGWTVNETPDEISLVPPGLDASMAEEIFGDSQADRAEVVPDEIAFGLEYQLRDFLAANLNAVDVAGRKLKVYFDAAGREGIEFPTDVGPIDILATDDSGAFFVFELKRAASADRAFGQLARYMGWVSHTIGKGRAVNGVIVAKKIDRRL